jgi:hypothetical protein
MEVDGYLTLSANTALTDVTGLYGLTSVTGDVRVTSNRSLATADADALVAEIDAIGGATTVSGNAP